MGARTVQQLRQGRQRVLPTGRAAIGKADLLGRESQLVGLGSERCVLRKDNRPALAGGNETERSMPFRKQPMKQRQHLGDGGDLIRR
ncbi:hypothetical protein D3C80_1983190 [compost metagenome]